MGGERKRKREKREYARRHYGGKKDKAMEKKREKMERYHMGKEDEIQQLSFLRESATFKSVFCYL